MGVRPDVRPFEGCFCSFWGQDARVLPLAQDGFSRALARGKASSKGKTPHPLAPERAETPALWPEWPSQPYEPMWQVVAGRRAEPTWPGPPLGGSGQWVMPPTAATVNYFLP